MQPYLDKKTHSAPCEFGRIPRAPDIFDMRTSHATHMRPLDRRAQADALPENAQATWHRRTGRLPHPPGPTGDRDSRAGRSLHTIAREASEVSHGIARGARSAPAAADVGRSRKRRVQNRRVTGAAARQLARAGDTVRTRRKLRRSPNEARTERRARVAPGVPTPLGRSRAARASRRQQTNARARAGGRDDAVVGRAAACVRRKRRERHQTPRGRSRVWPARPGVPALCASARLPAREAASGRGASPDAGAQAATSRIPDAVRL